MDKDSIISFLSPSQKTQLDAIEKHAITLLDHSHRFKYFTLHGKTHIKNLYRIVDLFCKSGLTLNQDQAFLLACSICVHDLGMVIPLSDLDQSTLFWGKPQPADPANLELLLRSCHHKLIAQYVNRHYDFLLSLGINPSQCALLMEISRCHREVNLEETAGYVRSIGALLRLIDELDIFPSRAPASYLIDHFEEMDATSCWHWFKHNICEDWMIGHNVKVELIGMPQITFNIAVHPPHASSIPYWLNQVRRPIQRVFYDEGAARIVAETWNLQVSIKPSAELSSPVQLGPVWHRIQDKALSAGRKVILVIDDEVRKLEDLLLPLMQQYHVMFSPNAKDALDKLAATKIHFAVVDLQIGSGYQWTAEETQDFKMTGVKLCKEIQRRYPSTKIGILTGSRHDLSDAEELEGIEFLIKKPVDPELFEKEVTRVLA